MSCVRCILLVKSELAKQGFSYVSVTAGEVDLSQDVSQEEMSKLGTVFQKLGLELINDNETILIEKIKHAVTELVYSSDDLLKVKFSEYISSKLGYSYNYLSSLFSSVNGISLEKYLIQQKIDRIKEIILHEQITFSELTFKMNYSSQAHLAAQFKKETGLTLSQFRELKRSS